MYMNQLQSSQHTCINIQKRTNPYKSAEHTNEHSLCEMPFMITHGAPHWQLRPSWPSPCLARTYVAGAEPKASGSNSRRQLDDFQQEAM